MRCWGQSLKKLKVTSDSFLKTSCTGLIYFKHCIGFFFGFFAESSRANARPQLLIYHDHISRSERDRKEEEAEADYRKKYIPHSAPAVSFSRKQEKQFLFPFFPLILSLLPLLVLGFRFFLFFSVKKTRIKHNGSLNSKELLPIALLAVRIPSWLARIASSRTSWLKSSCQPYAWIYPLSSSSS